MFLGASKKFKVDSYDSAASRWKVLRFFYMFVVLLVAIYERVCSIAFLDDVLDGDPER